MRRRTVLSATGWRIIVTTFAVLSPFGHVKSMSPQLSLWLMTSSRLSIPSVSEALINDDGVP